jgi:hypothetical protein
MRRHSACPLLVTARTGRAAPVSACPCIAPAFAAGAARRAGPERRFGNYRRSSVAWQVRKRRGGLPVPVDVFLTGRRLAIPARPATPANN